MATINQKTRKRRIRMKLIGGINTEERLSVMNKVADFMIAIAKRILLRLRQTIKARIAPIIKQTIAITKYIAFVEFFDFTLSAVLVEVLKLDLK